MILLLDTGVLGQLCHPATARSSPVAAWLARLLTASNTPNQVILPEICDYELRRKLLHLIAKQQADPRSLQRLDDLGKLLNYLPVDTETLRKAAELWSQSRLQGRVRTRHAHVQAHARLRRHRLRRLAAAAESANGAG